MKTSLAGVGAGVTLEGGVQAEGANHASVNVLAAGGDVVLGGDLLSLSARNASVNVTALEGKIGQAAGDGSATIVQHGGSRFQARRHPARHRRDGRFQPADRRQRRQRRQRARLHGRRSERRRAAARPASAPAPAAPWW